MKDGGSLTGHFRSLDHRKKRRIASSVFLILGIICIVASSAYSINNQSQNTVTVVGDHGFEATVTPANISVPFYFSGLVSVEITTQSEVPFSNITISLIESGKVVQEKYFQYNSTTFAVSYLRIPGSMLDHQGYIEVLSHGVGLVIAPINWQGSNDGIFLALTLYSGITFLFLGLLLLEARKINIWLILPVFVGLSIFFGQRYDDFFLISSGFRLISGVDPYSPSSAVLPGLQWAYPPLFLIWSYAVDKFYLMIPYFGQVTNASLNYLGTEYGNAYGAWKALSGTDLFVLYGLIKIPMVLSFLWASKILRNITGREQWNLWLLNPFVIVVAVLWGQLDVLAVAFMLQAILFHKEGRTWMAVLYASIGGGIKVFPLLIIPYMILRSKKKLVSFSAILPVLACTLAVYAFTGGITGSVYALLFARAVPTFGGTFVSNGFSWQVILSYLGVTTFPSLFLWVFIPAFSIMTVISIWRKIELADYAVIIFLIFFLTYNFVNPQYLIWLIPLFIVVKRNRYALLFSALGSIFMILTYSYTYFLNPMISWNYQSSLLGQIENIKVLLLGSALIRAILALIATILFVYMLTDMSGKLFFSKSAPD